MLHQSFDANRFAQIMAVQQADDSAFDNLVIGSMAPLPADEQLCAESCRLFRIFQSASGDGSCGMEHGIRRTLIQYPCRSRTKRLLQCPYDALETSALLRLPEASDLGTTFFSKISRDGETASSRIPALFPYRGWTSSGRWAA